MMILFILGIFLIFWIYHIYFEHNWDKNIAIHVRFAQSSVYAGEQTDIIEQIENQKHLPLPVLEVGFHMEKALVFENLENTSVSDFTYKRDIFSLLGYQRITRKLKVDCTKRGYYSIQKIDCQAQSLFFEHGYVKQLPAQTALYVYAKRADISGILTACEKVMGAMQCEKRFYEDPFAFCSIREYSITDPMKTINWKASAKTGELMVNTYESTLTKRVMLYLDLEDRSIIKQEHLIEESISVAATLAQKMLGRGVEVGIAVNVLAGKTELEGKIGQNGEMKYPRINPGSGKKQLIMIEQLLARRKKEEKTDAFESLFYDPPKNAVMIMISKNSSMENKESIKKFLGNDQGIWIIPYDKNSDKNGSCKVKTDKVLTVIRREVSRF